VKQETAGKGGDVPQKTEHHGKTTPSTTRSGRHTITKSFYAAREGADHHPIVLGRTWAGNGNPEATHALHSSAVLSTEQDQRRWEVGDLAKGGSREKRKNGRGEKKAN